MSSMGTRPEHQTRCHASQCVRFDFFGERIVMLGFSTNVEDVQEVEFFYDYFLFSSNKQNADVPLTII